MKIKKQRKGKYLGALILASCLSLIGCKENSTNIETDNNFEKFERQLSQLHTVINPVIDTLAEIIQENDNKDFIY